MSDHAEVEDTSDVDEQTPLPDLSGLPGVAAVAPPEEHGLDATYLDTAGVDVYALGVLQVRLEERAAEAAFEEAWRRASKTKPRRWLS